MRVTKTIKTFIEEKVDEKLMVKYQAEKEQAESEREMLNTIKSEALKLATKVYNEYVDQHIEDKNFIEKKREIELNAYANCNLNIANSCQITSIHQWQARKREEKNKIVQDIIVTLELGGTKADLMEMIDKI